jgi:hypothetical protein
MDPVRHSSEAAMRIRRQLRRIPLLRLVSAGLVCGAACGDGPAGPAPDAPTLARTAAATGVPETSAAAVPDGRPPVVHPVEGRYTGTVQPIPIAGQPSMYELAAQAEGVTSTVGRTRVTWRVPLLRIDPANRRLTVLSGPWSVTLTAANGDQVLARYEFPEPIVPFDASGNFTAVTNLVVTGGTGRFHSSGGRGVAVLRGNVITRQFTAELDGWATFAAPR